MLNKNYINPNKNLVFDEIHATFIHSLVRLIGKCSLLHKEALGRITKNSNDNLGDAATFYSNMSDAVSCMVVYLLNEEISNMSGRFAAQDILVNASADHYLHATDEIERRYITLAQQEIHDIFVNKINSITGSYFVDFTVSTFSAFEKWMCKIYPTLREKIPSKETKKKKLISLIEKFHKEKDEKKREKVLHDIMDKCGSHVSSAEMIDFVISAAKENYERNVDSDKNIVRFYGARRNTIHNFGVHRRESLKPITLKGKVLSLEEGHGAFTEDYRAIVDHCEELVDIYTAVVESLRIPKWTLYFESHSNVRRG